MLYLINIYIFSLQYLAQKGHMYEVIVDRRAPENLKKHFSVVAFDGRRKVLMVMQPALDPF